MPELFDASQARTPDHLIEPLFLKRWSPRAMSGAPLAEGELMSMFEAARWAPSTHNEQEWRFLYARRDTPNWATFFGLLVEGNQAWCHQAAVLGVVLSHQELAVPDDYSVDAMFAAAGPAIPRSCRRKCSPASSLRTGTQ